MISDVIRSLCALSILCGAALSITPEGTVKRLMEIVCSVVLITAVVKPLSGFDFAAYALELARFDQRKEEFLEENYDIHERLNRLVIEERYETYIMDKAMELNAALERAEVTAEWSMEGYWLPYSAELTCAGEECREKLSGLIEAELGIPAGRQRWNCNGTTER